MRISEIQKMFDEWAPKWVAWENDNVGLQIGNRERDVEKVLITLDVTKQVVQEGITKKIELIISHHPLLFRPPTTITRQEPVGELILMLAENKIAVFSAHTNLDYTKDGVSFTLANTLGLENIKFLSPLKKSLSKIVVFIPDGYVEQVMQAMTRAGAGIIGDYTSCSFRTTGRGSYRGSSTANPFLGQRGKLESVEETRLEMVCPRADIPQVVTAMKSSHPYEEVAYDILYLENPNPNFGMGAIGSLPKPQSLKNFLRTIKRALGSRTVRFIGTTADTVQKIAVCGGSGSELLSDAIAAEADVFVTADIRYHTFHSAVDRIALIDAGHFETEHHIVRPIADRLRSAARRAHTPLNISITKHLTNQIQTM